VPSFETIACLKRNISPTRLSQRLPRNICGMCLGSWNSNVTYSFRCLRLFKALKCQGVVDMRGRSLHDVTTCTASCKWGLGLPPVQ
jgi:hypothetical protein